MDSKIKALREAVDQKNWAVLKKSLLHSTGGQVLYILSYMLGKLELTEYRQVRNRHLHYYLSKNPDLVRIWKEFMQSDKYLAYATAVNNAVDGKESRDAFEAAMKNQPAMIKDWIRYELDDFTNPNVRTLLALF